MAHRRRWGVLLAAAVFFTLTPAAAAKNPMADVPEGHWAYEAVRTLAERGILQGYPWDAFQGKKVLTRYEMAMVVARVMARLEQVSASREDLEKVERLVAEFRSEVEHLGVSVEEFQEKMKALGHEVEELKKLQPQVKKLQEKVDPMPRISGYIQLQGNDGTLRSGKASSTRPIHNGIGHFKARTQMEVRQARLKFRGKITEDHDWTVLISMDGGQFKLQDAYLRARVAEGVKVTAGQFKTKFGHEGRRSFSTTNTVELSDVTRALYQGRDIGVNLGGHLDPVHFDVGVFQGQGANHSEADNAKDVIGRLAFDVTDNLNLGVSAHYGRFHDGKAGFPVRRWGAELSYREDPWKVEAEYLWSQGYNSFSKADTRARGGYAALVYRIDDQWDLVGHYDVFDPDIDRVDPARVSNGKNARSRAVLGVNYYFEREPESRLMINYEIHDELEGPEVNNNGWRVRYQFKF